MLKDQKIVVSEEFNLKRLDKVLNELLPELSRSSIQAYINNETITVNDLKVKQGYKVKIGDTIIINEVPDEEIELIAEDIPLDIVYEDDDLLVVNKNHNMVVHPAIGNYTGTLVNALMFHVKDFKAIKGEIRPGIVHRIDKETSGLLVVAKTPKALENLSNQMRLKTVKRKYVALVDGIIPHNLGKINAPLGRNPNSRQQMAVVNGGKESITNFTVINRFDEYTLVECVLETGRTHQIRVHLDYIGFPIVGDPKYGRRKTDTTNGQYLHAKMLGFIHPTTEEYMEFTAELPKFFKEKLENI